MKANRVAGRGVAVAVTVVWMPVKPTASTITVWAPTTAPSVQRKDAAPEASVLVESGVSVPPSPVANRTGTPGRPTPSLPCTLMTIESGRAVPTAPDCAPPDTTRTSGGSATTSIGTVSAKAPAEATTRPAPGLTAVAVDPTIVRMVVSSEVQKTMGSVDRLVVTSAESAWLVPSTMESDRSVTVTEVTREFAMGPRTMGTTGETTSPGMIVTVAESPLNSTLSVPSAATLIK